MLSYANKTMKHIKERDMNNLSLSFVYDDQRISNPNSIVVFLNCVKSQDNYLKYA